MVKYSLCYINYNNVNTIRKTLDAVLSQIVGDKDFEIIIVDGQSKDGAKEVLKEYAAKYEQIKVVFKKSSRGTARHIACSLARGEYLFSDLNLDEIPQPMLKDIVKELSSDKGLFIADSNRLITSFYIIPKRIYEEVGGWSNLHFGDDFEFLYRLIKTGKMVDKELPIGLAHERNPRSAGWNFKYWLFYFRDCFRLGRSFRSQISEVRANKKSTSQYIQSLILVIMGYLISIPMEHFEYPQDWWIPVTSKAHPPTPSD